MNRSLQRNTEKRNLTESGQGTLSPDVTTLWRAGSCRTLAMKHTGCSERGAKIITSKVPVFGASIANRSSSDR